MNINVALCDDEKGQLDYLESMVQKLKKKYKGTMDIYIRRFYSAEEFLFKYEDKGDFHIIFLDVEMKEINGVELARMIRRVNPYVQIVFITGYSEFMAEGYEVEALNYLLKPVKEDKFFDVFIKAVDKLKSQQEHGEDYVLFNGEDGITKIKLNSIMYLEAIGHQCKVFCEEHIYFVKESLGEIKDKLSKQSVNFILCHRSYMVNLKYMDSIRKTEVILDSGDKVPLSRRKYKEINEKFISYYTSEVK